MQERLIKQENCCSNACCDSSTSQVTFSVGICPQSGSKGRRIDTTTLKAMLAVSLTELRDTSYFFCKDADCPVVYFSEDGKQSFTTEQLRERVYQKESQSDTQFLCYCFRHTIGEIRTETISGRESRLIEMINAGIQAGQCACEIRNPQGSCCLGNVHTFIKEIKQSLNEKPEPPKSL